MTRRKTSLIRKNLKTISENLVQEIVLEADQEVQDDFTCDPISKTSGVECDDHSEISFLAVAVVVLLEVLVVPWVSDLMV
jgi:23S rRNA U2552 (ribose-2'-O)-methylase RlmE/FtsJ